MQDEAVLAERYLDGAIDALDLLLCEDSCRADAPPEHQGKRISGPCSSMSGASTLLSRSADGTASSAKPDREAQTGLTKACGMQAGIPRHHADQLAYDDFVLQYMAPNLPVMIEVGYTWDYPFLCHASRRAFMMKRPHLTCTISLALYLNMQVSICVTAGKDVKGIAAGRDSTVGSLS